MLIATQQPMASDMRLLAAILEIVTELERMGHRLGDSDGSFGGYQAIMFDEEEGVYYGASEVRKDGQAAGY